MQCAAMSAPQFRSAPRGFATIGFVPIESIDEASSRPPPIGCRPANAPKPRRAGRLHGGAQPIDDRLGCGERDPGCRIAVFSGSQAVESTARSRRDEDYRVLVVASPSLLTPWSFEPLQIAPTLIVAALYLKRSRTLALRGTPVPRFRRVSFWTGIGLVVLALNSPIDALGEEHFFFVHMIQHVIIGDLAPLCFVVGMTGPILRPVFALPGFEKAAHARAPARSRCRSGRSTSTSGTSRSSTTARCTTTRCTPSSTSSSSPAAA